MAALAPTCRASTIVVLTYNPGAYIDRCLSAVLATDYPTFDVTVVDNASTDGSVRNVRRDFPEVALVETGANLGFSRGNNLAMREATAPLIALLNPDTEVDPGWLRPLVERMHRDPVTGGAAPKILYQHDRVPVDLRAPTFVPDGGGDTRELGVRLYGDASEAATGGHQPRGVRPGSRPRRGHVSLDPSASADAGRSRRRRQGPAHARRGRRPGPR